MLARKPKRHPLARSLPYSVAWVLPLLVGLWGTGCSVSLVSDLDEASAAEVASALSRNGVLASRHTDPEHEGKYSVSVDRADTNYAMAVMTREELPRTHDPASAASLSTRSFIESRQQEHARQIEQTAAELSRTLASVHNVVSARVHLAVRLNTLLGPLESQVSNRASVLVKYSGSASPLTATEVKQIVSGAISGLEPAQVIVVTKQLHPLPPRSGADLVKLGPLTTTLGSLPFLRGLVLAVTLLNTCMLGLLIAMWRRWRLLNSIPSGPQPPSSASASDPASG